MGSTLFIYEMQSKAEVQNSRCVILRPREHHNEGIRPLNDPVTWYGINDTAETQVTQWNFQNERKSGWIVKSSFVLLVSLQYLCRSIIQVIPYHVTGL